MLEGGSGGLGVAFMTDIVSTDAGVLLMSCLGPLRTSSAVGVSWVAFGRMSWAASGSARDCRCVCHTPSVGTT